MAEETPKFELPEEYATYFGTEKEFDSFDDFKDAFGKDFIRRSAIKEDDGIHKEILGKRLGHMRVDLQRLAKEDGFEFTTDEKDLKVEEQWVVYKDKLIEKFNTEKQELESKIGSTDETQINELNEKLEKLQKKNQEKDQLLKDNKVQFEDFKSGVETDKKNTVIDMSKRTAFDSLELPHDLDPLRKTGFQSHMNDSFKTDLDDEGKPFITKDGNRIPHPEVADTFMSIDEVYKAEADKLQITKMNPHAGKTVQKPTTQQPVQGNNDTLRKAATPITGYATERSSYG